MTSDRIELARGFTAALADYHSTELANPDTTIRDAVIVKMVALLALAFDVPPTDDDADIDVDATIERLRKALYLLQRTKAN